MNKKTIITILLVQIAIQQMQVLEGNSGRMLRKSNCT